MATIQSQSSLSADILGARTSDTDMLRRTPSGKSEKSSSSWQSHGINLSSWQSQGINLQMIDQANSFLKAAADDSKKSFIANQLTLSTHCTNFESLHAEAETVSLIRATLEALHKEVTGCVYAYNATTSSMFGCDQLSFLFRKIKLAYTHAHTQPQSRTNS